MKIEELRDMSDTELNNALEDKIAALFNLRFQKAKSVLENKHVIRMAKRDVARIKTLMNERKRKNEV